MRRTAQLDTIKRAIQDVIPGAATAFLSIRIEETEQDGPYAVKNSWTGTVRGLAERVHTALYGEQAAAEQAVSPLHQAEEAKRRPDLHGELGALLEGERALTSAPWYPAQPGDIIHVHYEQAGTIPPCGETYLVQALPDDGLFRLRLVSHSHTQDSDQPGAFEVTAADDPLFEPWFEAGPQRLTIVRHGRVVHNGGAR